MACGRVCARWGDHAPTRGIAYPRTDRLLGQRVAAVQFEAGPDPESNVDRVVERVRDAAADGADLVVLPEIWNVEYFDFEGYRKGAESIDGPTVTRLQDLADELGITSTPGA